MFNRKFSSNIRRKKRMIISIIILLVVFLGIGYSAFTTNLGINGTLTVDKYDQTLYGVLEKAAKKGYAREYTGEHQDSMAGVGTKKIYHWYAQVNNSGNNLATEILDKNNVIFADHCWQMIRTTDTGGVKMIYNGEAEDNQCLNTRGNHVGYSSTTTQTMSTTYYYGTSYTYDKTNNVFSLDGTITTGTIQTGQYTCRSTSSTGTCANLYLVDTLDSGTSYNVFLLNSTSHYSQFGLLPFNQNGDSPAYAGYMYNIVYPVAHKSNGFFFTSSTWSINTSFYYSDTIDYNTTTPNEYTLLNPIQISTLSDYNTLVGKYVSGVSGTHSSNVLYIIAVNSNGAIFRYLTDGDLNTSLTVGDSYTKSGNTYTLTNPTNVTYIDWYSNTSDYSIYKGKYVCDGNNNSCTNLRHISTSQTPSKSYYYYFDTNNTYSYSEGVSYSGGTYNLTGDIKTFWDVLDSTNQGYLSTHHYTCLENGTSCSTVNYANYMNGYMIYYTQLSNVINESTALNNMLNVDGVNQINSTMKTGIDAWYKKYMTSYTSKLEDTIFCNDRSISDLGAWNPSGGIIVNTYYSYLEFKNYTKNSDLSCTNTTDKFSLANTKAQLTYPVGLLSYPETILLNNDNIRKTGQFWWLLSPNYSADSTYERIVNVTGNSTSTHVIVPHSFGVRPVISLKPGTEYVSGTGSMADPYIVDVPMATLRIYYKSDTGATLHETYVETMPVGASYSVTSPIIFGYTTSQPVVADVMGKNGANISVIYYPEADPIIG